jgi:hypothetical protein
MKHVVKLCGQRAEFIRFKAGGRVLTGVLGYK